MQLHQYFSPLFIQGDLASLYIKAGVKNIGIVLLMTDAQVADEKFLVLVNDLLASGRLIAACHNDSTSVHWQITV